MATGADAEILERIFNQHGDRIYAFCLRLCANATLAEDLAAEVFLDAPKSLRRFRGEASEVTFLYRIAINKHRNLVRSQVRSFRLLLKSQPKEWDCEVVAEIAISQALQQLSPKLREAFLLVKAEGMQYAQASVVLGVPIGTVQSRVHVAGKRLAKLLDLQSGQLTEVKNEL